jgi:hypothetical protein
MVHRVLRRSARGERPRQNARGVPGEPSRGDCPHAGAAPCAPYRPTPAMGGPIDNRPQVAFRPTCPTDEGRPQKTMACPTMLMSKVPSKTKRRPGLLRTAV